MCIVDFEKAFKSIEHGSLWQALLDQGVAVQYVRLLSALYRDQCGHICGGAASRKYAIERGTKQGGPRSPVLLNAALEQVMGPLQELGKRRTGALQYSMKVGVV